MIAVLLIACLADSPSYVGKRETILQPCPLANVSQVESPPIHAKDIPEMGPSGADCLKNPKLTRCDRG